MSRYRSGEVPVMVSCAPRLDLETKNIFDREIQRPQSRPATEQERREWKARTDLLPKAVATSGLSLAEEVAGEHEAEEMTRGLLAALRAADEENYAG